MSQKQWPPPSFDALKLIRGEEAKIFSREEGGGLHGYKFPRVSLDWAFIFHRVTFSRYMARGKYWKRVGARPGCTSTSSIIK